jgi:hypothetical protein
MLERDLQITTEKALGLILESLYVDAVNLIHHATNREERSPIDAAQVAVAVYAQLVHLGRNAQADSFFQCLRESSGTISFETTYNDESNAHFLER